VGAQRGGLQPLVAQQHLNHPDIDPLLQQLSREAVPRFVCCNGLVVGDVVEDIRIPHKGNIQGEVIEGAFRVLDEFIAVEEHAEGMKALQLDHGEQAAFATAALALRFGERIEGQSQPAPVTTAQQLIQARRMEDVGHSLWTTFQRVQ